MKVEVVFARPERQALIELEVPRGTSVGDAVRLSGLAEQFPDVDFEQCRVGVWGRVVGRRQRLRDGDRVELYRPLWMDPREARRRLAEHGRTMGAPPGDDGEPEGD